MSALRILPVLATSVLQLIQEDVLVRRDSVAPEVAAWRASLPEGRPVLRGFRAPILDRSGEVEPIELPREAPLRDAAVFVSRNLARDGLLATTAAAIQILGVSPAELEGDGSRLRAVGLPVDLLECFRVPGDTARGTGRMVRWIASAIAAGERAESLRGRLNQAQFAFQPSLPGFEVATESGEHEIGMVRLQLTRGTHWTGPGDGGSLDIARQLVSALPRAQFVASVEEKHVGDLVASIRDWSPDGSSGGADRLTVISEALPVAQWAQDSGKPGLAPPAGSGANGREAVTLVPRYASRGEDGAWFVPGETFLMDGFARAGHRVVQSPLLFQGGNLLAVRDPVRRERLLLIGEADVWRNTALGLSREQAVEAFRIEFGVDRCSVLPAVSFHIDQEISPRALADRLVVLVADPTAAARIVLASGVDALEAAGHLSREQAGAARADLEAGRDDELVARLEPATAGLCQAFGRYPESLARAFSRGEVDSGVGNLQRFLLAVDMLASSTPRLEDRRLDPHSIAYLRSLRRRGEDRERLFEHLRGLGFTIAPIPSLPETLRGIDYLNGIQERGRYLMPAWGGLYEPLDRAAEAALRRVLGPGVEVVTIASSESQRRGGALHCSVSVYPKP